MGSQQSETGCASLLFALLWKKELRRFLYNLFVIYVQHLTYLQSTDILKKWPNFDCLFFNGN